jgi:zinc protease
VDAIAQVGVDVKAVETAIWSELDRIARDGVTEKEVTKSKNKLEAGFVRGLTGLASRADHLQRAYTYTRDTENANHELGHIRSVTAEDIQRVARKYFRPESCVALEVQPKAG